MADLKGKKRKVDPSSKAAPPAKKAAIATPAGPSKAKAVPAKEIKPVVKDAKSDSSFFSSRTKQAKTPMPSFKKNTSSAPALNAPAAVKADPNVAQPSSINPFAEILAQYQGPSATGSSNSTPPPAASGQPANSMTGLAAGPSTSQTLGKRKKSVTWAPDGQLEQIKLIERAVYDDDGTTVSFFHLYRDMYCMLILWCFALSYRVRFRRIIFAIWTETRELHCTTICSKSRSSGQNHNVSTGLGF